MCRSGGGEPPLGLPETSEMSAEGRDCERPPEFAYSAVVAPRPAEIAAAGVGTHLDANDDTNPASTAPTPRLEVAPPHVPPPERRAALRAGAACRRTATRL